MGIFTRFLGVTDEGRGEIGKYYAVLDTEAKDDVAIVWQDDATGQIRYVCDCCVSKKYWAALPVLKEVGRWGNDVVEANEGGTIERFIQEQQAKAEPLNSYYQKMYDLDSRHLNDSHIRNQPAALKKKIAALREKIAEAEVQIAQAEAEIPQAEASVREHERILAEGLPEVPVVDVMRLETLAVEGEEAQKLLFPEIMSPASARD